MSTNNSVRVQQPPAHFEAIAPDASKIRMEIDEFLEDDDTTNLFLLALAELQKEDRTKKGSNEDWFSFYSMAGIHGLPDELWNNIENGNEHNTKGKGSKAGGYCTHGSTLFPTWHRVYIYMFEYSVSKKMHEIARLYEDKDDQRKYTLAADRFKLPFWDPFMLRDCSDEVKKADEEAKKDGAAASTKKKLDETVFGIPQIFSQQEVWVRHWSKDGPEKIQNPLQAFSFPSDAVLRHKGRKPWISNNLDEDAWITTWSNPANGQFGYSHRVALNGRLQTLRTPTVSGETNYFDRDSGFKEEDRSGDGLNLVIRRQAQTQSAKVWRLLSSYEWTDQDKIDAELDVKDRERKAFNNKARTWASFANHFIPGERSSRGGRVRWDSSVSLESWHDDIHVMLGVGKSSGHMTDPGVAAYDPIFWLHHNNIDRLLAIWQALHPDESDDQEIEGNPAWWLPSAERANGQVHADTSLYPFQKGPNKYWTSNDVKDWRKLGFAVPGSKTLNEEGRNTLEKYLRENYYWATEFDKPPASVTEKWPKIMKYSYAINGPKAVKRPHPGAEVEALDGTELVTFTLQSAADGHSKPAAKKRKVVLDDAVDNPKIYPPGSLRLDGEVKSQRTWTAQIEVKKFAFNGSFTIHIFIGHIKKSQAERFFTKKNEVGFSGVFASDASAPCANCIQQREQGLVYEDAIPLTMALTKYLKSNAEEDGPDPSMRTLESLEVEPVREFLKEHLHWVITNTSSDVIDDVARIRGSGLQVSVWDSVFELPTRENNLGLYHPGDVHPDITSHLVGGLGYVYED